jgi:amidophosphoribosyltransferase
MRAGAGLAMVVHDPAAGRVAHHAARALGHRGPPSVALVRAGAAIRQVSALGPELPRAEADAAIVGLGIAAPRHGRARGAMLGGIVDGDFVNSPELRAAVDQAGGFCERGDATDVLLHLVAQSDQRTLVNRVVDGLSKVHGGRAAAFLAPGCAVAARDPRGIRPLWMGRRADATVFASESLALEFVGAAAARELDPGELVIVDGDGVQSFRPFARAGRAVCVLEGVALAAAGSSGPGGREVAQLRERLGEALARQYPARADVVVAGPGGEAVAAGFGGGAHLPVVHGLQSVEDTGAPRAAEGSVRARERAAGLGMVAVRAAVGGRRVVLVLPAIASIDRVSGMVALLRESGVVEVHLRAGAGAVVCPCPYGASPGAALSPDVPAAPPEVARLRVLLGVDSVAYLDRDVLRVLAADEQGRACDACLGGAPPVRRGPSPADTQVPLFAGAPAGPSAGAVV